MSVKERITKYLETKKLSARGFSLSIGMSENYISSMKNSIQPVVIDKIAVRYPDLNTGWLLTGNGEMLNSGFTYNNSEGETKVVLEPKPQNNTKCPLCREKDARIKDKDDLIAEKEIRIKELKLQIEEMKGQVEFLKHIIETPIPAHPLPTPKSGTG